MNAVFKKHFLYATVLYLIIISLNISLMSIDSGRFPEWSAVFYQLKWSAVFCYGLYLINAPLTMSIQKLFPEKTAINFVKRLLLGVICSAIASLVGALIIYVSMLLLEGYDLNYISEWLFSERSLQSFKTMLWISVTVAVTFYVIGFIQQNQANKIKEQKEKVVQISTEHESLKSQIGPHFLFNSLNVLNGLIAENQDKAQEFVSELSSVYRYVLEQKDKSLVSLQEEIDFSRTYMNLVQKRFEDGLEYEVAEYFPMEYQIVPLSLQILLENCIKHNRVSSEEPLKIKVYLEDDYLIIKNNLQIKKQLQQSTGKGLQNIIQRYKSFTRKKVEIATTNDEFIVKIPLLTEKIITMEIIQNYTEEEIKAAKKRVKEVQDFYWNLASYVIVNLFLTFLDLKDNGEYDWAYWPILGWGIGLFFHYVEVFGFFNSTSWKDKMVQKELERRKEERDRFFN